MVDYAYYEDLPSSISDYHVVFNDAYPTYLPFMFNGTYRVVTIGYNIPSFLNYVYRSYDFAIAETKPTFVNPYESISVNNTVYAFKIARLKDITPSDSWYEQYGVCYYVQVTGKYSDYVPDNGLIVDSPGTYMRLPADCIKDIVSNPLDNNLIIQGESIDLLVSLGQNLLKSSHVVYEFLTYDIGGTNLITILFGSGFMIYVSWVVIKWFIPI